MIPSYRITARVAKRTADLQLHLEEICWHKLSELFQAVVEAEVDEAIERLRYERRSSESKSGYRDGHDRGRTVTSNRGPIDIKRPRVRGASFRSAILPKHRRRLQTVDSSPTELWLDGLATRDFEGTLRAFLGADAPLSAATITRANKQLFAPQYPSGTQSGRSAHKNVMSGKIWAATTSTIAVARRASPSVQSIAERFSARYAIEASFVRRPPPLTGQQLGSTLLGAFY